MMAQHSTSKRCPWLPCRDAMRQNKAESLDAKRHSIGPDRPPSNGASQGDQGKRGRGPERGAARRKHQLLSSRCHRRPGPLSTQICLVPETNQKMHAPRGTLPAGALPRPTSCHIRWAGTQVRLAGAHHQSCQGGKSPKYPLAESLDSTKASGPTVGYHD